MSSTPSTSNRSDLSADQVKALQTSLDSRGHGKIIEVRAGMQYDEDVEQIAAVGEKLMQTFTGRFVPGGWRVRFVMLDSEASNAYAYWKSGFEAICMTNTLAREIDYLCNDVALSIGGNHNSASGFAYLKDIDIPEDHKLGMLKGLLVQAVVAVFLGHEAGHLGAGHKPVFFGNTAAADSGESLVDEPALFVDELFAAAKSADSGSSAHSARFNAHEVDADVQGFALASAFWLTSQRQLGAMAAPPYEATVMKAAFATPERLLLLVSTGAAIAVSLMGFKKFTGEWDQQTSHPLTALRCLIGLTVLGKLITGDEPDQCDEDGHLPLMLRPECMEALSLVHARLGEIVLAAAKVDGKYSPFTLRLKKANKVGRLRLMFRATGIAQAVAKSKDVVRYLAELSAEFDACASLRKGAIRVVPATLVQWSALAP